MKNFYRACAVCAVVSTVLLTACVFTGAKYIPNADAAGYMSKGHKNPDDILIGDNAAAGHHYKVIGRIDAYGRSLNLVSPVPTREDVNRRLREEAAKRGADAVINVQYQVHKVGFAPEGKLTGTGEAVVFTN